MLCICRECYVNVRPQINHETRNRQRQSHLGTPSNGPCAPYDMQLTYTRLLSWFARGLLFAHALVAPTTQVDFISNAGLALGSNAQWMRQLTVRG
eukprot:2893361-Prymnesium_polylepis.1